MKALAYIQNWEHDDTPFNPIGRQFLPLNPGVSDLENALLEVLRNQSKDIQTAEDKDWYQAVATILRNQLIPAWRETKTRTNDGRVKRANYLSMEYLLGPNTITALHATKLDAIMRGALRNLGQDPTRIFEFEPDPGLGNGGLGRLAACFMDSCSNLNLPAMGYGLYYKNGFFRQIINESGYQVDLPDTWVENGNPWGIIRTDRSYKVAFFDGAVTVDGVCHDMPTPSHDGKTVNTLRLWEPGRIYTREATHEGSWLVSKISDRLYPPADDDFGKKLRLMQEYFFTSMSLQDIVARHRKANNTLDNLADSAAIQLNDTHPAIAVPELIRILTQEHGIEWERAKDITQSVCSYTNHTLMPEALEKWSCGLFDYVLPVQYGIINRLHSDLVKDVDSKLSHLSKHDRDSVVDGVSIIKDGCVRMGHLAAFGTGNTNGVSAMHSELVAKDLFPDLVKLRGASSINNCTNGITPRRWLLEANPELSKLITEKVGNEDWLTKLPLIDSALQPLQNDPEFRNRFREIKRENKKRLASLVKAEGGPDISPDAVFDIQVKRFHEYKRQFMNIVHTVALYQDILENPDKERPAVVKIFAGKAAPTYDRAKDTIALTNFLANVINNDTRLNGKLKLYFIPDYNVSKALVIIPAADLSEQISTAGKEASGTSNMKFALNGAVTIGTRDGANVEIGELTGEDNIFFFGKTKEEIDELRVCCYDPHKFIDARLHGALMFIQKNTPFAKLSCDVWCGDHWMIASDFGDYWNNHERAQQIYMNNPDRWMEMAIQNTRKGAHFSSDDTIRKYAQNIWGVSPCQPKEATRPAITQIKLYMTVERSGIQP